MPLPTLASEKGGGTRRLKRRPLTVRFHPGFTPIPKPTRVPSLLLLWWDPILCIFHWRTNHWPIYIDNTPAVLFTSVEEEQLCKQRENALIHEVFGGSPKFSGLQTIKTNLFRVFRWSPQFEIGKDSSLVTVWVKFYNLHLHYYIEPRYTASVRYSELFFAYILAQWSLLNKCVHEFVSNSMFWSPYWISYGWARLRSMGGPSHLNMRETLVNVHISAF